MKTGSITYNGKNSLELGVYTTGSGSFDAAELDVDKYEIPGRNGDLILSNNRYKNIEITYPAFIPKAFMDKVQNVRNWLRSSRVYARLEDTYDPDHYRLSIPTGVQSFEPANRNDGANFEMTFDCKPQRFLKAGETPETVEPDVQTASGEIASFETDYVVPLSSAEVSLSPQQDLNGYDSPWPGGGGKNKFEVTQTTQTVSGVTVTISSDGVISLSGTASAIVTLVLGYFTPEANTSYYVSGSPFATNACRLQFQEGSTTVANQYNNADALVENLNTTQHRIRLYIANGTNVNGVTIKPMIRLASESDASFSPYSNICPISGHTGAELIRTGKNLASISMESYNATQIISNLFALKKGTYTISFDYEGTPTYGVYLREGRQVASSIKTAYNVNNITFTLNRDYDNLCLSVYYANGIAPTELSNIMVELGSSATDYETYQGSTYSVTFSDQGTVYWGTFDFATGKLRVEYGSYTFTGSESWYKWSYPWAYDTSITANGYSMRFSDIKSSAKANIISDAFVLSSTTARNLRAAVEWSLVDCCINNVVDYDYIVIRYDSITDPATFAQYMAGKTIVYELETPLEYTLSAQQIETLLGENNVWSDAGPITLTYAEPFTIENPTLFDARPLFTVTNPAEGDVITVNGQTITFVDGYSGTVFIDCETMNAYSGAANLNSIIEATDFPVLVPGTNIVTWTGTGECTMTPRWWEL